MLYNTKTEKFQLEIPRKKLCAALSEDYKFKIIYFELYQMVDLMRGSPHCAMERAALPKKNGPIESSISDMTLLLRRNT